MGGAPEVARKHAVEMVMDFAWVGLDRLSRGERWSPGIDREPAASFVADMVDAAEPASPALVFISREGERSELSSVSLADRSARLAGTLAARGVERRDVVMTVLGNRPEWAYAMLAWLAPRGVAQPCTEQLRPADLRLRMELVGPRAVVADERDLDLVGATGFEGLVLALPDPAAFESEPAATIEPAPADPALIVFTSGTAGEPKPVRHGHGYLTGQHVQAEHWYGARPGDLCWCTAASGWSLSARNAFVAAWLRGATALLHDARFDPDERLDLLEREQVAVLCMSPTEYRAIAKRAELRELPALRHARAAGEPLNPEVVRAWQDGVGVSIHDGYGQTETGHLTGMPIGPPVKPGSMGRPLPGFRAWVEEGELGSIRRPCRPSSSTDRATGPGTRATGQSGRRRLPLVRGPYRRRDHLGGLPHRAVRGRVRAGLAPGGGGPRWPRPMTCAARWCALSSCCATASRPGRRSPASCRST